MQNKGLVKLFAILFGLVSIYQLSFTFKANQIENDAKEVAISKIPETEENYREKRSNDEASYLESIAKDTVFNMGIAKYTYDEVKQKAMNLGLDLKGGINVILQISVKDILKGMANNTKNPIFNKALDDASELQKNSQNTYLEDFFIAFDKIKGDTKLASPDIFATRELDGEIVGSMSDDEVKNIIESQYQRAIKILTENKDKLITLAEILLKKEVIFKEDLEKIFGKRAFGALEEKQPESLSDIFGENKDFPTPENPVEPKI